MHTQCAAVAVAATNKICFTWLFQAIIRRLDIQSIAPLKSHSLIENNERVLCSTCAIMIWLLWKRVNIVEMLFLSNISLPIVDINDDSRMLHICIITLHVYATLKINTSNVQTVWVLMDCKWQIHSILLNRYQIITNHFISSLLSRRRGKIKHFTGNKVLKINGNARRCWFSLIEYDILIYMFVFLTQNYSHFHYDSKLHHTPSIWIQNLRNHKTCNIIRNLNMKCENTAEF